MPALAPKNPESSNPLLRFRDQVWDRLPHGWLFVAFRGFSWLFMASWCYIALVGTVGRHGLGKEEEMLELKRRREEEGLEEAKKRTKDQETVALDFQDRQRSRFAEQKIFGFVKACRKACEQLDKAAVRSL